MNASSELKREVRERVWKLLEERGVVRFPRPVYGRIPNFLGAEVAAKRILQLEEFNRARVVKVNPDSPQMMVRRGVLEAGKTLLMPSPRLRRKFLILDPKRIPRGLYGRVASISGAFQLGEEADLEDLPKVDLLVCGSVAVTERGERIGKGGGYSELEYAILRELGLVADETPIATSVHELQIVEELPMEMHDFTVDYIATPERIIRTTGERRRPKGIIWEELPEEEIAEMPLIRKLRKRNLI
ncbi:5-formyltetrahydrofolate cyclo-ligase [Candidatus Bathyarchaeota archaeon]|nr:5-formyltetrahydrofolate cyclo-ligase [Candidatus Bathyarchaeota archaeon]